MNLVMRLSVLAFNTECLRDLKRFLRMDEQENLKTSHLLLGKWNIVSSDLIPMLVSAVEKDNLKLAVSTCEVLVPLTWPLKEPNAQLEDYLLSYKLYFDFILEPFY